MYSQSFAVSEDTPEQASSPTPMMIPARKEFSTEPLLFAKYSVDDIAKGITFVMFRVFKSLGPSELHDGSWQVRVQTLRERERERYLFSIVKNIRNIWVYFLFDSYFFIFKGNKEKCHCSTFACSESPVQQNCVSLRHWGIVHFLRMMSSEFWLLTDDALEQKQILYSNSRESQEAALSKTIELAKSLKKMKNFEGMAAVTSVFGNATIQRLKPLWANLKKKVRLGISYLTVREILWEKILVVVEKSRVDQFSWGFKIEGLGRFTEAPEHSWSAKELQGIQSFDPIWNTSNVAVDCAEGIHFYFFFEFYFQTSMISHLAARTTIFVWREQEIQRRWDDRFWVLDGLIVCCVSNLKIKLRTTLFQTVGETIHQYLTYKNVEYDIGTPDVDLIRILEEISIVDEEALEVFKTCLDWGRVSELVKFRMHYIVSHYWYVQLKKSSVKALHILYSFLRVGTGELNYCQNTFYITFLLPDTLFV